MGYRTNSNGFRIYNRETRREVERRIVGFLDTPSRLLAKPSCDAEGEVLNFYNS